MASRRLAKSTIDWAKFAENVTAQEHSKFTAFRAKSQGYTRKVESLPENLPKIDFAALKKRAPHLAATFDQFQKQYSAVEVPYPKDTQNSLEAIAKQEAEQVQQLKNYIVESEARIAEHQKEVDADKMVPPTIHTTHEEFAAYYPELVHDDVFNPKLSFWPHHPNVNHPQTFEDAKGYKIAVYESDH